jgi:hypothetical protein
MPKADRVHSTPPTNAPVAPTRRHFLSRAAGVAAGSAALALATTSARVGRSRPSKPAGPCERQRGQRRSDPRGYRCSQGRLRHHAFGA